MSHQATKYHRNIGTGVSFGLDEALGRFVIQAGVGWGHCESGDAVLEIMLRWRGSIRTRIWPDTGSYSHAEDRSGECRTEQSVHWKPRPA